jgi:DNA-directed DNA polymerase III PolC
MSTFTPLRVRSHGSLLCGVASPEALIGRALERGFQAMALTDRDNLYLAIRFYREALREGLRPLPGAELTGPDGRARALLIPLDRHGYANLSAIITRRHLEPRFDAVTAIAEGWAGLHVIVESPELAAALLHAGVPAAAGWNAAAAPRDAGLWIGVRGVPAERTRLAARLEAAHRLGVPVVATGDVMMLDPADHEAHRAAVTAAAGELIERMPPSAFCAREAWLASAEEWSRRIAAVCGAARRPEIAAEALANNRALVDRCRLELDLGTPIFPRAPLPPGTDGGAHLRAICDTGITWRYAHGGARAARARLATELTMIERMGFTDYFLLVAEIVRFARATGIPTVGRGSGAASLVAYVLGITNVDPIRYELCFERFLNPSRRDCPDLDIDLCWRRRDEVIAHVYDTYGHDRVAMISTHTTLGARSAFRETAKALGVPNERVNALAKHVPRSLEKPYADHLRATTGAHRVDWSEPVLAEALRLAERLDGAPRHLSIHCGGIVIADRPITHYVPLQRAAKDVVVTQFEMRAIEAIGLVKMDLLGNRALSTIGECVSLARAHRGADIDADRIPCDDAATSNRLAEGDTLNCFQLESPAMRHLLRMLHCRTLDETIAAVALVRPGPAESGMKAAYCRRQRGLERPQFHHPRIEPVLRGTHGVMLYEEDVMRVAAALTGISLAEGDDLRRALGAARDDEAFRSLERGFVMQAKHAGVDAATARIVWRDLTRFAAYGFCKAHAAGYGTLGYQSTYLGTHFPAEYAVGILNHHAGMYATWVHVEDLRRRGVVFLPPCAHASSWDSTYEPGAAGAGGARAQGRVRVGLSRVYGLHEDTARRAFAERGRRAFAGLADFVGRARPSLPELEALILAGALDWTGRSRPSLLLEARANAGTDGGARRGGARRDDERVVAATAWDRVNARGANGAARHDDTAASGGARRGTRAAPALLAGPDGATLETLPVAVVATPDLPEFDARDRVIGECRATGLWFSGHPLDVLIGAEARRGTTPAARVPGMAGRRVRVAGLPCAYRRVETKSGGLMLFMTLADESGVVECTLFPDTYRRLFGATRGQIVRVEGRVEATLDAVSVTVERADTLA